MTTSVRRGLVLGAGGALGAAWMVGALSALEEVEGFRLEPDDVVVGTSAGSVLASLLACGVDVPAMAERLTSHQPQLEGTEAVNAFDVHAAMAAIPRPTLLPGNVGLAVRSVGRPSRYTLMTMAAGLAPRGHGDLHPVADLIADAQDGRGWPVAPTTWIVAMDFDSGRRVVFGRDDAPAVPLPEAVMASCAAPGFFPPVPVAGRRYVDGGAVSMTNADVLLRSGLDEILVLAPMASAAGRRWDGSVVRSADRRLRGLVTRRLEVESRRLAAVGTRVRLLAPTHEDLTTMGVNVMNPRRRHQVFQMAQSTTRRRLLSEDEQSVGTR